MSEGLQLRMEPTSGRWTIAKDGDDACRSLFRRHYSFKPRRGRRSLLFVGPGRKLVLITARIDALFVWRKFRDDSGQTGINCAVFRNESNFLSSVLILEAEAFAWNRWPKETRLYTYVNARKVRHKRDPGRCFRKAGWSVVGTTKCNRLVILAKERASECVGYHVQESEG